MNIKEVHRRFKQKQDFYVGSRIDDLYHEVQLAYAEKLIEDLDLLSSHKVSRLMDSDLSYLNKTLYIRATNSVGGYTLYKYKGSADVFLEPDLITSYTGPEVYHILQAKFIIQSMIVNGVRNFGLSVDDPMLANSYISRSWRLEGNTIKTQSGDYGHDYAEVSALTLPPKVNLVEDISPIWSDSTAMRLTDWAALLGSARLTDPSMQAMSIIKDKMKAP